jgi:putative transposase
VRFTTPCVGQIYFYQRDGKGLTLTELRQLALDLRKQDVQLVGKSSRRMRLRDVAFQELKTVLKYQVEKYGKELVLVEPAYTSKACARCVHVKDSTLADHVFCCGWVTDRDYNASLNVLRRSGLVRPVVPVELRPPPAGQGGQGSRKLRPLGRGS